MADDLYPAISAVLCIDHDGVLVLQLADAEAFDAGAELGAGGALEEHFELDDLFRGVVGIVVGRFEEEDIVRADARTEPTSLNRFRYRA